MTDEIKSQLASMAIRMATSRSDVAVQMKRVREEFDERAAIREYLGGHPRWQAENAAFVDAGTYFGFTFK